MDKGTPKYVLFGFICFGLAVLIVSIFKPTFKLPIVEYTVVVIGGLFVIIAPYYLFKSKRPFIFVLIGSVVGVGGYLISSSFLSTYHPILGLALLIVVALLALLFTSLAVVSTFKELFKRK
jgi:hypothetical protein